MSYKIEIQGHFLVVTDTTTTIEEIREPAHMIKFKVKGDFIYFLSIDFNPLQNISIGYTRLGENIKEFDSSIFIDHADEPLLSRDLISFLSASVGFATTNNGSGSGSGNGSGNG
jgi:hypothetical protein